MYQVSGILHDDESNAIPRADYWIPEHASGKTFPDVPEVIASAADEAFRCASIAAWRAAIMMARAVIEATAKQQGIISGMLGSKIDKLHYDGLISETVRDEAHEIRHLGNDMAHGDLEPAAIEDDVKDVLALMSNVLLDVCQRPAQVAARRRRREEAIES